MPASISPSRSILTEEMRSFRVTSWRRHGIVVPVVLAVIVASSVVIVVIIVVILVFSRRRVVIVADTINITVDMRRRG